MKSNAGKAVGRALKKQAISTGTNLLADIVAGNNLKEGIDREVGNIRQNAALGIQQLTNYNNNNPYESEIETSKKIQSKRKNQTKNKKQTKKKNQPPKKGGKKFNFLKDE